MEIFYLNKQNFLPLVNKKSLEYFSDKKNYQSEDKYLEHLCGLFLTKFIAKNFYNISKPDIGILNSKPYFKNSKKHFSISHSENIIAVAFNNNNIGFDIEIMKPRNFKPIMKRYNQNYESSNLEDFYRFWTKHEAQIKLNRDVKSQFSTIFKKNYYLTVVSDETIITDTHITELSINTTNCDLIKNFQHPQEVNLI